MKRRRLWLAVPMLLVAAAAFARVGGGESYSGGGSSGGGGGDGGGIAAELVFQLIRLLFWLTIHHPAVGIPLDIVVIAGVVMWLRRSNTNQILRVSTVTRAPSAPARFEALRRFDPNFSLITFSDFCYSLYARAHYARAGADLDQYAPYISKAARNALRQRNRGQLRAVRGVVIGAFRPVALQGLDTQTVTATVEFEANYTEDVGGNESAFYVVEQWRLERRRDILSPPPEKAKADHCPRCGAALQTRTDGACNYCGVKIDSGAFQWFVTQVMLMQRDTRGPLLTSNVPERGTNLPTVRSGDLGAFTADWAAFEKRVREIAKELQDAWTARDWERVRPLESESLFQMHRYWIDAYKRQHLRNIVSGFRVTQVELARFETDAFYEAATVRIFAEGLDHTVDEAGRLVAGSDHDLRRWSEYWTFIRTRQAGAGMRSCPNCGAAVAVGATGVCQYCGGKLTAGEFDWVLSRIEQDEAV